ncbi:MAG TPA: GNAT family N-acetyltransferase [Burkholderiales bacterium]|nr:GNAT family N-acetyltransferase [Burkholderiales bacterium]
MVVAPLTAFSLLQIEAVMREGRPWLPQGTDYWLWQACFGTTSFIASADGALAGGVLACVNQAKPDELYVDQVAVHPAWRGRGVTGLLLDAVSVEAGRRGCQRVWLSTDPANPATRVWPRYGFAPLGVKKDLKGPGKDRAVFERRIG